MARTIVYSTSMVALVAATAMTFAAINLPTWISWSTSGSSGTYTKTIGLHQSYSSTSGYKHFPTYEDCHGPDRYFCSMWRSLGFMMWIAAVLELVSLVGFMIVILGGKSKRDQAWKVMPVLLVLVGGLQAASMSIVAYLFDNDDRFFVGWKLDQSFVLCTASWCISLLAATFIVSSSYIFPKEASYEFESIPSERTPLNG